MRGIIYQKRDRGNQKENRYSNLESDFLVRGDKMINKASGLVIILTLFVCFFCGCNDKHPEEAMQSNQIKEESFAFDWGSQKMIMGSEISKDNTLSIVDFKEWNHEEPSSDEGMVYHICDTEGGKFYDLQWHASEEAEICLHSFDVNRMEESNTTVPIKSSMDLLAVEYIADMDVAAQNKYTLQLLGFRLKDTGEFIADSCRLLSLDMEGQTLADVDMYPFYADMGLFDGKENVINPVSDCILDSSGNSYTRSEGVLYIADSMGKELMTVSYGKKGVPPQKHILLEDPICSDDGKLIFPKVDSDKKVVQLVWFDLEAKKECVLFEFSSQDYKKMLAMRGFHIYYCLGEDIIRWHVGSGEREVLFSLQENGIHVNQVEALAFKEDGTPVLRILMENQDGIMVLGKKETASDRIELVDVSESNDNVVQVCAAVFSRNNPLYHITYDKAEKGQEKDYRNRVMAQLSGEDCPQLFFVSRDDLNRMPKESLLDLRELIAEDILDTLLPGALELGTVDGKLLGIPIQVSSRTLITYQDIWSGESWELQDILKLCEQRKELKAILPAQGEAQAFYMLTYNPLSIPYIDWKEGVSHFESEQFISLLTYLQEHQLDEYLVMGEDLEMLKAGECLAVIQYVMNFSSYESIANNLGEDRNMVGLPAFEKHGSYLETEGVLAVSAKASNKEAIAAFLEYLLSEKGQQNVNLCSVKRNAVDESAVIFDEDGTAQLLENGRLRTLHQKKDNTTYISDYNAYMEQCVAKPFVDDELRTILDEELAAFFAGGKSAAEVAKIIDNRAQLYLNERK